jgi:ABC-type nickel/cobalt efflux system permease component RcnA
VKIFFVKILYASILIPFLFLASVLGNKTFAHPQPLVVNEFNFVFSTAKIEMIYRMRIDPVVIDDIFKVLDKNNDKWLDDIEIRDFSDNILLKNLTINFNGKSPDIELISVEGNRKQNFRSLDNFFEIKYLFQNIDIKKQNSIYAKYEFLFLPDDPFGDLASFLDNAPFDNQIRRVNLENTNPNGIEYYSTDFIFVTVGDDFGAEEETDEVGGNFFDEIKKISSYLTNQVKNYDFSNPIVFLTAFIILFTAGALHAITPGHGKSMVAAFLIGKNKSKFIDVIILGITITLAHTLVIYIIGFFLLLLQQTSQAQNIVLMVERFSAWLFLGLGIVLIFNAWRNYKKFTLSNQIKKNNMNIDPKSKSFSNIRNRWDLIYAGISGGIIPCFDALSILFVFNTLGRADLGIILVFIFSLGLATAIISLGLSLLYGKDKFRIEEKIGPKAEYILPFFTGGIILLFGIFYIFTK